DRDARLERVRRRLTPLPPPVHLPPTAPAPGPPVADGDTGDDPLVAVVPGEALRALTAAERTTTFTGLLAAWHALLAARSGASAVASAVPVAGRDHPATESLVGCFVNLVLVPTTVDGERTFRDLVRRV